MFAIEPLADRRREKELRAIGVFSRVGTRQKSRCIVRQETIVPLIGEFAAVDTFSARAVS